MGSSLAPRTKIILPIENRKRYFCAGLRQKLAADTKYFQIRFSTASFQRTSNHAAQYHSYFSLNAVKKLLKCIKKISYFGVYINLIEMGSINQF